MEMPSKTKAIRTSNMYANQLIKEG